MINLVYELTTQKYIRDIFNLNRSILQTDLLVFYFIIHK